MRVPLLPPLLVLALGSPALGQAPEPAAVPAPGVTATPDESWRPFPGKETSAASEPASQPPASHRVSLSGGKSLEPGQRALGVSLGFPFLSAKASLGLLPRVDVGVGVDSFYGVMTSVHAHARVTLLEGTHWALAAAVEGGYAFFLKSPLEEVHGARFLTGRRNWNLLPGLVGSYQGASPGAMRFFLDVRYHLAFDTEPLMSAPLGGVSDLRVAGNLPVRLGFEVPFSERTSYVIMLGAHLHGRPEDAAFMPTVGVGLVTPL